jgi:hypothetical protein
MVTGGQTHDSQVIEEILTTPRSPLAVTADKAYDMEKVRQQIKVEGALPIILNRSTAIKKAYCPHAFLSAAPQKSKTFSAASRTGGVSPQL